MSKQRHRSHAIVVLPPGSFGRVRDAGLRRWLSKGWVRYARPENEMLHEVVELVGHSARDDGLAALQFWGQTGDRSGTWMAAVDLVHLEARLDHLCLYALRGKQLPMPDLRSVFDYLQQIYASEIYSFVRIGRQGYLRGDRKMVSARVSARFVDGQPPDRQMPARLSEGGSTESHHRLVSEVQMALHEHKINIDRQQSGLLAINSIWIWGGGTAAEVTAQPLKPLFSDDPLFKGFWLSRSGLAEPWPKNFDTCVELSENGFVAVTPEVQVDGQPEAPDRYLQELRDLLKRKKVQRLSLLFRDGLRVDLSGRDAYRFWRRESSQVLPG